MIDEVGNVYSQGKFGDLKILRYSSSSNVEGEFLKTKTLITSTLWNIRHGLVKDWMTPLIQGVGFIGSKIKMTGDCKRSAVCWYDMLKRCYSERYQKDSSTYSNCEVSEDFKNFTIFNEWWKENHIVGMDLDKDLLHGSLYSAETCVFLPPIINNVIKVYDRKRKLNLPVGIEPHTNNRYIASILIYGKRKYLGIHNTVKDARSVYLYEKNKQIVELAELHRADISLKAYNGLINLCNTNV